MNPQKILVLGAGELGASVLQGLARHPGRGGSVIDVMLRPKSLDAPSPDKRRIHEQIASLGVNFRAGDLIKDSVADLAGVFSQYDTVIGCTGFVAGRNVQTKLAHAAVAAGIRRYFPWQFGVDYDEIGRGSGQDVFDEQLDVRDILRSQTRIGWVIVSTGMFTSFLFEPSFCVVDLEKGMVRALGRWDNEVTVTTPDDIGKLTAEIVFHEPEIIDRIVYTAGDTISYGRLAETVENFLGRQVFREEWTVDTLQAALSKDPENSLRKYRLVFAKGCGISWDLERTFNFQQRIPTQDVLSWLKANRS